MMVRTIVVVWSIAFALCQGAAAAPDPQRDLGGATLEIAAAHQAARAHVTRKSPRPTARTGPTSWPGPPPGPGYCWYYIDRATRAPGFWDLCRER